MSAVTIPNAGKYDLLVDVGFLINGLTLDDPAKGILGTYSTTTTRTNAVTNPSFTNDVNLWAGAGTSNATIALSTAAAFAGTTSLAATATNAGSSRIYFANQTGSITGTSSTRIPVTAGTDYTVTAYTLAATVVRAVDVIIQWYDNTNTVISTSTSTSANNSTTAWTRTQTLTATAPANAVTCVFSIRFTSVGAGEIHYIDAVLFEQGSSALPYFDGTTITPYSGYTMMTQTWNGTADASTSTVTWGLDSSACCGNSLDGDTTFASVAEGTMRASVRRGRQDPDDQFTAGIMTFTLNDTLADGVFNPFDDSPSNPYYDQALGVPGLAPGRAVQLIRYDNANNPEYLFVGFIVNYEYQFRLGGLDTVTVLCADNLYRLANTGIEAQNPTQELTGARVNAILDLPEVDYPTGAARSIAAGSVTLGGGGQYSISQGTNVLAYFNQITATAERGRIFVDREGVLVSQNRIGNTLSGPAVTFSDQGDVPYNDLTIDFKADEIINLVDVTTRGSHTAQAVDTASQNEYFIKALFINDSLLHDTTAAQDLANYLLEPEPTPRFTSVQSWFGSCTIAERDSVAVLEIGDTVLIQKKILIGGNPTLRGQESAIEGIEHRIDFDRGHTTRVYTSPTTIVYELILDDANQGILDTNVLG